MAYNYGEKIVATARAVASQLKADSFPLYHVPPVSQGADLWHSMDTRIKRQFISGFLDASSSCNLLPRHEGQLINSVLPSYPSPSGLISCPDWLGREFLDSVAEAISTDASTYSEDVVVAPTGAGKFRLFCALRRMHATKNPFFKYFTSLQEGFLSHQRFVLSSLALALRLGGSKGAAFFQRVPRAWGDPDRSPPGNPKEIARCTNVLTPAAAVSFAANKLKLPIARIPLRVGPEGDAFVSGFIDAQNCLRYDDSKGLMRPCFYVSVDPYVLPTVVLALQANGALWRYRRTGHARDVATPWTWVVYGNACLPVAAYLERVGLVVNCQRARRWAAAVRVWCALHAPSEQEALHALCLPSAQSMELVSPIVDDLAVRPLFPPDLVAAIRRIHASHAVADDEGSSASAHLRDRALITDEVAYHLVGASALPLAPADALYDPSLITGDVMTVGSSYAYQVSKLEMLQHNGLAPPYEINPNSFLPTGRKYRVGSE